MKALLFLLWAVPALATPREEIAAFIHRAGAFEAADPQGRLAEEISTLRDWVLEAQRNLKDEEAVTRSLERVRAQAALIEALLARSTAEAAVREARGATSAVEREAIELRRQAAEAERARAVLEQKEAALRGAAP